MKKELLLPNFKKNDVCIEQKQKSTKELKF